MTGDVAQILAAQQGRRVLIGCAMAGAVKSVAANAVLLLPLVGRSVGGGRLIHKTVEAGLNHRDQRNAGKLLAEGLNGCYIRRIVRWRKEGELLHRPEQLVADQLRLIERSGMDHLEPDRADLLQALERLVFARNRRNALANGRSVIRTFAARLAYPFHATFRQNGLRRHIQHAVLERSATDIWNQAFHLNVFEHS